MYILDREIYVYVHADFFFSSDELIKSMATLCYRTTGHRKEILKMGDL